MNISVVGTGYVGLVTGTCLAELGNCVTCVDADESKIALLREGEVPIYEPQLKALIARNTGAKRLRFSTRLHECLNQTEVLFIAVGTPSDSDGRADLSQVYKVAQEIGDHLTHPLLVVNKSTVPVGTASEVRKIISEALAQRGCDVAFDVASNPEFLKEGRAISDFMEPDRVVVGVESEWAKEVMTAIYRPMQLNNFRVLFMDVRSAEMTKYAANAMLATRISFMNEIANLCERVGADISQVRLGIGSDSRIGLKFLYAGCGYGGSCFPKDVRALIHIAKDHDYSLDILRSVEEVNERQKQLLFQKFSDYYNHQLSGKHVAVWGLSFKPGTDDMRMAPSITLIDRLLAANCTVTAYDPVATDEARKIFADRISYAANPYAAVDRADALFHVTEWKEYRIPDWRAIRNAMNVPLLIDGRNVFDPSDLEGFTYLRIG